MSNKQTKSTTRSRTTIDTVFQRFLNKIQTETFVSYFSHHKPLESRLEISDNDSRPIVEKEGVEKEFEESNGGVERCNGREEWSHGEGVNGREEKRNGGELWRQGGEESMIERSNGGEV
ncbi:hypothetical protein PV325_009110 [Microctonus aethiopoides]|nr:hypothetical protein PV325_009110 [Microctonus aethiopoides]